MLESGSARLCDRHSTCSERLTSNKTSLIRKNTFDNSKRHFNYCGMYKKSWRPGRRSRVRRRAFRGDDLRETNRSPSTSTAWIESSSRPVSTYSLENLNSTIRRTYGRGRRSRRMVCRVRADALLLALLSRSNFIIFTVSRCVYHQCEVLVDGRHMVRVLKNRGRGLGSVSHRIVPSRLRSLLRFGPSLSSKRYFARGGHSSF